MFTREAIEDAAVRVHSHMLPTAQHCWPLISARAGTEVWVKHENHTPIGTFKMRGGLVYMAGLGARDPGARGVISATRGNHGQSLAFAARALDIPAVLVVPEGNSVEKNAAMRALGAELIVHGADYQAAREHAEALAGGRGLHYVEPYHASLVLGVASYPLELHHAVPDLERLYVPVGMGSGVAANIRVRDALDSTCEIVGVVAKNAPMYALSYRQRRPVSTDSADTIADGIACRVPDAEVVDLLLAGAADVIMVSEDQIRAAMRAYYTDTHNVVEGAGAAALAALIKDRKRAAGKKVAVIASGGNVDAALYREILANA